MPIDSNFFHTRVGVYNLNMQFCKKEPNIRIKCLPTMPFKKSFKKPFFVLVILFLLVVFLNSSFFFIFNGPSDSIRETNLTWSDYMFTIRYFINNFKHLLLLLSGDIETNPGPKRSSNIKFCHWNLNGLAAHDFIKVPLVEAFITSNNFDLVCLSETFLYSAIPNNDINIKINEYSSVRADHPNDIKRGDVCIFFKESLPLIRRNDLTNIEDCIVTEINVNNKKRFSTCPLRKTLELNNHFMKHVTITSLTELKILIYLFLLLILGKYRIVEKQILNISKNRYIILIVLGLFKIEIATKNAKFYQKHC